MTYLCHGGNSRKICQFTSKIHQHVAWFACRKIMLHQNLIIIWVSLLAIFKPLYDIISFYIYTHFKVYLCWHQHWIKVFKFKVFLNDYEYWCIFFKVLFLSYYCKFPSWEFFQSLNTMLLMMQIRQEYHEQYMSTRMFITWMDGVGNTYLVY